ncbi:hypothetical protein EMCRGX_G013956 [Ephydatia muelleri]
MASTACSGLAHLHVPLVGFKGKPPIAHRDIKSANILVKDDLTCCLADMGLAFVGGRKGEPPPIMPPSLSRWDLGTRRYLSPEILCAHQCHPTSAQRQVQHYIMSDVYAMALVIWEMCRRTVTKEGDCDPCAVPYEGMVPSDPSVEDMRKAVCSMKKRPPISERWNNDQNNYKRNRDCLSTIPTPAVPYIGVFLKDLTFICDGNPDYLRGGLINVHKRRQPCPHLAYLKSPQDGCLSYSRKGCGQNQLYPEVETCEQVQSDPSIAPSPLPASTLALTSEPSQKGTSSIGRA